MVKPFTYECTWAGTWVVSTRFGIDCDDMQPLTPRFGLKRQLVLKLSSYACFIQKLQNAPMDLFD